MEFLSEIEKQHIIVTFRRAALNVERVAAVFYEHLFEIAPHTRSLFHQTDMRQQGAKLMSTLMSAVSLLDDSDALTKEMRDLGARHQKYGVSNDQYESVGDALLYALQESTAIPFTDEELSAWRKLYAIMARAASAQH